MSRPRVLVLRALGLGDLLAVVPALRACRRAWPDHELVLAAPRALAGLAAAAGVDRVVPARGPGPVATRPRPEIAVNLHGRGPRSHRALLDLSPGRLLAHACPAAGFTDGPDWLDEQHEAARWCRLLAAYGIPAAEHDLLLPVPEPGAGMPRAVTVLHPGAAGPARRWPSHRFAAVAGWLAGAGHRVILTGGPDERDLAARVAAAAKLPATAVLAGSTTVDEVAALVAHARLVVANDTGVAHLATAYRTPSVVLCGPVPPARWGPSIDTDRHAVCWHPRSGGPPADDPRLSPPVTDAPGGPPDRAEPHPALLAIPVAEVCARIRRVAGGPAALHGGARPAAGDGCIRAHVG